MNEKKVTQIPLDSPFSQKFSLSKEEEVGNTQYVVAFKSKLVLGDKRKFNTRPQAMDFMKSETSPSAGAQILHVFAFSLPFSLILTCSFFRVIPGMGLAYCNKS